MIWEASWAVLEAVKAEMYVSPKECRGFCLLEGLLKTSWGVLEGSWAVRRPSGASWTDRSATRGLVGPSEKPLGALLARLEALLGHSGAVLGPLRGALDPADPRGRGIAL
eukprot:8522096-Pyramimonas_sp.AAC.1